MATPDRTVKQFPNEEPSSAARQSAKAIREMYVALLHEGFERQEALVVVGQMLTAAVGKGGP